MAGNPPVDVQEYGQSIWLDYIHRKELQNGKLQERIEREGVVGVTSNPSIFQKAIGDSDTYDDAILTMLELAPEDIYERLAIQDIQDATDLFRPIYDRTGGNDGFVSLEVSPLLASDTEKTVAEARRLYEAVDRPNLMIKIPATPEGIPAIEETIASGINVNVTLIFAIENYQHVAEAFIRGLERRLEAGEDVTGIASVASFFLSRIDVMVDRILENNIRAAQVKGDTVRIAANRRLLGQTAVASAKLAYRDFRRLFEGERFSKLRAAGAQVQRPLWASTSAKNPAYPDTKYVDTLIGAHTVNTLPPKTLAAFTDHGLVDATIEKQLHEDLLPDEVMDRLAEIGIDIDQITQRLQDDGVDAFIDAFEKMIGQVAAKRSVLHTGIVERQLLALGIYVEDVQQAVRELEEKYTNPILWAKNGSLWKDHGPTIQKIENRLGWLDVQQTIDRQRLQELQDNIRNGVFQYIVLLGMGGSSLAPEVLYLTFGRQEGFPELIVIDSTDPARIQAVEDEIDLKRTLFIVASKSGGTIETLSLYRYFYQRTDEASEQFIAITDEFSQLENEARDKGFADVFVNPSDIGGRYSALSYFGMVPAALIGLDLKRLWHSADTMIEACGENIPGVVHPGIMFGAIIGALAAKGRDKLSIFTTKSVAHFGKWAEQLIAESLGKEGKGIVPVTGATIGHPHDYGSDRLFIYLRVDDDKDMEKMDEGIRAVREAGHPRMTMRLPDSYALAGEFFRWEYATAIAGKMLDVNPFDEPNVTEAKDATRELLASYQETGNLPTNPSIMQDQHVQLFADETTLSPLRELCAQHGYDSDSLVQVLAAQVAATKAGDYFAILAYLTPNGKEFHALRTIQRRLRHATKRATTLGFGPRYLHSTGQLHKGGANNGIFFQITYDPSTDIEIPEAPYSFGTLFAAQAEGDFAALQAHSRRVLRLHVSGDVQAGLDTLLAAIDFVAERRK